MKKVLFFSILFLYLLETAFAQVGVGTTSPDVSSMLEVNSTDKGVLIPRINLSQRGNIDLSESPESLFIYQTDNTPGFYYYDGSQWIRITTETEDYHQNFSMLSADRDGVNFTTSGSDWRLLSFTNAPIDSNSEFNTTNSQFTATYNGYYHIEAQFSTSSSTSTSQVRIGIFVGSTLVAEESHNHSGVGIISRSISKLFYLNAGDIVTVKYDDGGTAMTVEGWAGKTFLSIHRVR